MKTNLICSTYNQPLFLEMVLDTLLYQTSLDFELIIADDGSDQKTKAVIENFRKKASFSVKHLWHEDNGWRKCHIHNEALRQSQSEHLIFIDGDCLLGKNFIKDHQDIFDQEKENFLFMGRRVDLGPRLTEKMNINNYRQKIFSSFPLELFTSGLSGDSFRVLRKYTIKNKYLRKLVNAYNVPDLLGCNFSTTKTKMIEVNGLNEDIQHLAGGGEDGDLFIRLRNSGTKIIGIKYFAEMYHLWHPRGHRQETEEMYQERLKLKNYIWAPNGLSKRPKITSQSPS